MGPPTVVQRFRQTLGRALRETGQALDRLGIKGHQLAVTKQSIGDEPVIYEDNLSRHRHQMPLLRRGRPVISQDVAFLAPCSTLIGSVHVGAGSSIFYKSILRADNCENAESFSTDEPKSEGWELDPERFTRQHTLAIGGGIFIGENTNIQDGCIIDAVTSHTTIGNGVTVGHMASIHSATVHDNCLIGRYYHGCLQLEHLIGLIVPSLLHRHGISPTRRCSCERGGLYCCWSGDTKGYSCGSRRAVGREACTKAEGPDTRRTAKAPLPSQRGKMIVHIAVFTTLGRRTTQTM